ncbi:MAG TPA: CbiX/SirB N-terminal domain-containing protein [Gemmatimonadaceae bacterium]|nr:CbiX/SirB N-terminal domain-containing protein [Gemmatimonadaceae bacterium]
MQSILLIDHGSRRAEANEMLACMANLVQQIVGDGVAVEHAHMELAEPDIAAGFARCVARGASEVVAFPYMLSPGRHATGDIPRLVAEAARAHPDVTWRVTDAFGVHEQLAEVILLRAGIAPARRLTAAEACRCWHPTGSGTACGGACRARPEACAATEAAEERRARLGTDAPTPVVARAAVP